MSKTTKTDTTKTDTCPTCHKTECPAGCPGESAASRRKSRPVKPNTPPAEASPLAAGWTPGPLPRRLPVGWEACRAILATLGRADLWTPAGPTAEARAILEAHPTPEGPKEDLDPAGDLAVALRACLALAGECGRCDLAEVLSLGTAPLRTVSLALLGMAATGEPSALFSERETELDAA